MLAEPQLQSKSCKLDLTNCCEHVTMQLLYTCEDQMLYGCEHPLQGAIQPLQTAAMITACPCHERATPTYNMLFSNFKTDAVPS
jgi:hypothetical protein